MGPYATSRCGQGVRAARFGSGLIKVRLSVVTLTLGVCLLSSACARSNVIWSEEVRSPDGTMVASARTVAQSEFGTDFIGTSVYLNWTKGSQSPREILVLSDGTVAPGATAVEMKWLTPTHLELTYVGPRKLDFQAAKYAGIDISVRDLSTKTDTSQK